jgi:hypothetical protein
MTEKHSPQEVVKLPSMSVLIESEDFLDFDESSADCWLPFSSVLSFFPLNCKKSQLNLSVQDLDYQRQLKVFCGHFNLGARRD